MSLKRFNELLIVDSTPTLDTNAYSANDVLGGLLTLAVCKPGGAGILRHVDVVDDDNQKIAGKLHIFNAQPTALLDDAEFLPVVADLKKRIGQIQVNAADYVTWNSNAQAFVRDQNIDFVTADGSLYVYYSTDGTPTHAATGLRFRFIFWIA